jgi:hypothetical protein
MADQRGRCHPGGHAAATPDAIPDIEDRGRREMAQTGEIEIWLAWNGLADLDLGALCPDKKTTIDFEHRVNCGGRLDVDMNCSGKDHDGNDCRVSEHPVEHILWPAGHAGPGPYQILVSNYHDGPPTRFAVRLKKFGVVQDLPGGVAATKDRMVVADFAVP